MYNKTIFQEALINANREQIQGSTRIFNGENFNLPTIKLLHVLDIIVKLGFP